LKIIPDCDNITQMPTMPIQDVYDDLQTAAKMSSQTYGDTNLLAQLDRASANQGFLKRGGNDFELHRGAAAKLAEVYGQHPSEDISGHILGHAKAARGIFEPLAKLVDSIRKHREAANLLENALGTLRSQLAEAMKPLIEAGTANQTNLLSYRAKEFFKQVSNLIKQNTKLDYDFLLHFTPYNPDAGYVGEISFRKTEQD
jgi:hypothetical protein